MGSRKAILVLCVVLIIAIAATSALRQAKRKEKFGQPRVDDPDFEDWTYAANIGDALSNKPPAARGGNRRRTG